MPPLAAGAIAEAAGQLHGMGRVEHHRTPGFRHDREARVKAVTDLGPGFWVVTPLEDARGFTVLINRGFVPSERASPGALTSWCQTWVRRSALP